MPIHFPLCEVLEPLYCCQLPNMLCDWSQPKDCGVWGQDVRCCDGYMYSTINVWEKQSVALSVRYVIDNVKVV